MKKRVKVNCNIDNAGNIAINVYIDGKIVHTVDFIPNVHSKEDTGWIQYISIKTGINENEFIGFMEDIMAVAYEAGWIKDVESFSFSAEKDIDVVSRKEK